MSETWQWTEFDVRLSNIIYFVCNLSCIFLWNQVIDDWVKQHRNPGFMKELIDWNTYL
jgi:hypothetical protein